MRNNLFKFASSKRGLGPRYLLSPLIQSYAHLGLS